MLPRLLPAERDGRSEMNAKAKPAEPTGTPEDRVREWLKQQGYPLEFEAARILRSAGFLTVQGWSYPSTDERGVIKARDVDVIAAWVGPNAEDTTVPRAGRFIVAVEAKHLTSPWVVLTSTNPTHWKPLASEMMTHYFSRLGINPAEELTLPHRTGFAVKTIGSGQDVAYEALTKATSAALAAVDDADDPYSRYTPRWALPVVVVRDDLFTLGYDDEGLEILESVPWCRLVWHGTIGFRSPTLVDVVTRDHWPTYVAELRAVASRVVDRVEEERQRRHEETATLRAAQEARRAAKAAARRQA
jgi:hypothetical protein